MSESIGWADEISVQEKKHFVFDDGDTVTFLVTKFEKAISSNNNPMAKLEIKLSDTEGNEARCFEHLVLCRSMAWKLKNFFVSIGKAKSEDNVIKPAWDKVEGASGLCKVTVEAYEKNGEARRINKIAEFLPPVENESEYKF